MTALLQNVGLQRQSRRLGFARLAFRFRYPSRCCRRCELHPSVVEVDSVLREAQSLSFVIGEKLRVEDRKVYPVGVFPIFRDEQVIDVEAGRGWQFEGL